LGIKRIKNGHLIASKIIRNIESTNKYSCDCVRVKNGQQLFISNGISTCLNENVFQKYITVSGLLLRHHLLTFWNMVFFDQLSVYIVTFENEAHCKFFILNVEYGSLWFFRFSFFHVKIVIAFNKSISNFPGSSQSEII